MENNVKTGEVVLQNKRGLHLRLASALVKMICGYKSQMQISKDGVSVNARSMLDLVSLSAAPGSVLQITVTGDDAEAAYAVISKFLSEYNSDN